jgi:hypothetical protein
MVPSPPATATRGTPLATQSRSFDASASGSMMVTSKLPDASSASRASSAVRASGLTKAGIRAAGPGGSTELALSGAPPASAGQDTVDQNSASARPSGDARSFSNARSRICRMRSRVTPISSPIFSRVMASLPSSNP